MDKKERQKIISGIIAKDSVQSQEDLLTKLSACGVAATQATLSRDLKELGIIKQHTAGAGYRYILKEGTDSGVKPLSGAYSIEFTACLAVIKTIPGYAGAIASRIDAARLQEVAGSIAGDDTVILALRTPFKKNQILQSISSAIGEIPNKII